MPAETFVSRYWGKARPEGDEGPSWHPLAYHGLDVAAAGAVLLKTRPQLLTALATSSGLPVVTARQWLLLSLALHDIGKYADCFQCKVPERWHHKNDVAWSNVQPSADRGHGRHGIELWVRGCDLGTQGAQNHVAYFGAPSSRDTPEAHRQFGIWFAAVCGHHGRPVDPHGLSQRISQPALSDVASYVAACAELFDPAPSVPLPRGIDHRISQSSWLVAGLAMLTDWIGSNAKPGWFPYLAPDHKLKDYWPIAQDRARRAIAQSGLGRPTVASSYALSNALPGTTSPAATPLQVWAEQEAAITGQSLVVIEDLTGAGKTEAALIVAHRLMQTGAAEGLYWALPTMATADALYQRLAKSYASLFEDAKAASLVLAHSSREFNQVFQKSLKLGDVVAEARYGTGTKDDGGASETASAACARWIADDRRKTFLADVGVGTIDQAVLGVLPSKHQAMRLTGLCRLVLVIDEIHSLDAYQNSLVETLLQFHGALGGSAILISATLTMNARQRLAKAFAVGAGWKRPKLTAMAFPLATVIDAQGPPRETPIAPSRGTRRDLPVHRLADNEAAMQVLAQAAEQGRAAVWIRNTVQDARDAFIELKAKHPDAKIDLFHARFALGDRLSIQDDVLQSFGKNSRGDARRRILIATQVVEQSLDCDWDVMITDLAPIDLIIQRAGRLHRHDRQPPDHPERPKPILYVVSPDPADDAGERWYEAAFPRGTFVYPHHGRLWTTMRSLTDTKGLNLASASPRDLIERVYAEDAPIPSGLNKPAERAQGRITGERAMGRMNALDLGKGYVHHAGAWESDTRTPTRLGDPTRTLRLARWDGSRLAPWCTAEDRDLRRSWRLSEVSVLAARLKDIAPPDVALEKAIAAEVAQWPDRYDPPLLVPLVRADGDEWTANAVDGRDASMKLRYSSTLGLSFERQ